MSRKLSHEALKKKVEELETEVSKLKRSESELRDSEARFRAFMNYYPAVIYIKDVEGRHVFGNDAALKITNRGLEDFLGKTSRDFFPPDIAKEIGLLSARYCQRNRGP
jgi:PAS domain S-box-containing protein